MLRPLILLLFFSFLFINCSEENKQNLSVIGEYKSSNLTISERLAFGTSRYIKGMTLILREDSSYFYDTCGVLLDGTYEIRNDSLVMSVIDIRFKNDSINSIRKPEIRNEFLKYRINENVLYGSVQNDKKQTINKLVKEK